MYKLILGNKNYSSWSMRPWLALKKAGIDFEEIVISLYKGDYKAELKPYSPSGKVPVLITDEVTICDSLAICEYAAEIVPALWPQDQPTRALARSISHEMHSGFAAIRNAMPMNCRANNRKIALSAEINDELSRIETIWSQCLETHSVKGPWLFGTFTIADAMYAPIVARASTYSISLNQSCNEYMQHVLNDDHVKQWYQASASEVDVIEAAETGIN